MQEGVECHSTGTIADVCLTKNTNKKHPEYGKAGRIWASALPGDEWKRGAERRGAGMPYDPDLHLVYYGTGNPALVAAISVRRADNAGELQ